MEAYAVARPETTHVTDLREGICQRDAQEDNADISLPMFSTLPLNICRANDAI
jgi:hypothetical protein